MATLVKSEEQASELSICIAFRARHLHQSLTMTCLIWHMPSLCMCSLPCVVCAAGLCVWSIMYNSIYIHIYIYMCICHKNSLFGIFWIKNSLKKCSWRFPFTLRHREYDGWLPVHPRSSAISVSLLALVPPLRGRRGPRGAHTCSLIGRCIVTPTAMLTWQVR